VLLSWREMERDGKGEDGKGEGVNLLTPQIGGKNLEN
jgi:hypothetical protein